MKFIKVETENRSKLQAVDATKGLDLLKRTRESRPVTESYTPISGNQIFHLSSLFNAVELLVHMELLGRADGFQLLIGRVENKQEYGQIQIHTWLRRNSIVYHVDDPTQLPIVAEDQRDFERTPGICLPLQTIEHYLLQVNRPLMRAAAMAVKTCRSGQRPLVRFDTMEVTQELLQTAITDRTRSLDQHLNPPIEPPQKDIDLRCMAPVRWVM